ncbi:hypothetical protein [Leptolyngbya sp. ST-U4]|uniref:hypothetical protein n=1 Tax=Leptolyngbya sp. ST-U4 TaxID=2933912 RepID=UPI003298F7C3
MFYRVNALLIAGAIVSCQVITTTTTAAQAQTAAAAACAANPYCIGTVVVGGILYLVLSNGTQIPYSGTGGYLEDPEGSSEDWSDYVWADSLEQAQVQCQQYAINAGAVLVQVVQRGNGKRYECKFRTYRS